MSVETAAMFNNNHHAIGDFKPAHSRSRSYNELLNKFKQQITTESTRFRNRKRSNSDLNEDLENNKRSRTAPPRSQSPEKLPTPSPRLSSKSPNVRSRSLSPNKALRIDKTERNSIDNGVISHQNKPLEDSSKGLKSLNNSKYGTINKSDITLPSISTVLSDDIKTLNQTKLSPPTTSLDYFDTKPNEKRFSNFSNDEKKPIFNCKISKPVLPPVGLSERKINFPYESNYTYLNKTYLNDVERYPEYLELAQSLVQLSKSDNPVNSPKQYSSFPPLYPYQVQQQPYQQQNIPYYQQYYPYQYQYLKSPSNAVYAFQSNYPSYIPEQPVTPPKKHTKFIPITPPSSKINKKEVKTSSPKNHPPRVCISCGSDQSPCWRPSWSSKEGQLCNSCGLRYKKTSARCLNDECKKIPAKGEWSLMLNKGLHTFDDGEQCYSCLECGYKVEVKK